MFGIGSYRDAQVQRLGMYRDNSTSGSYASESLSVLRPLLVRQLKQVKRSGQAQPIAEQI